MKMSTIQTRFQGIWFQNDSQTDVSFAIDTRSYHDLFEKGNFLFANEKSQPFLPPLLDAGSESWKTLKPGEKFYVGVNFSPTHRTCIKQFSHLCKLG